MTVDNCDMRQCTNCGKWLLVAVGHITKNPTCGNCQPPKPRVSDA